MNIKLLNIPDDVNYFDLFALECCFKISIKQLEKAALDHLKILHPDKFISASKIEQEAALRNSGIVNLAFQILKDPMQRAEYMLKSHGYSLDDAGQKNVKVPQDLLIQSMNWQEELEEADDDIKSIVDEVRKSQRECYETFDEKFSNALYDEACEAYMRLKFIQRFLSRVDISIR